MTESALIIITGKASDAKTGSPVFISELQGRRFSADAAQGFQFYNC